MQKLLIVEDDQSVRTTMVTCLELEGYEVIEAANSYEGLQAADAALLAGVTLDIRYLVVV